MRIVITGASGTGKTTLLNELCNRGHIVIGETARFHLNRKFKGYPFTDDKKNLAFQEAVLSLQLKREKFFERTDELIFFERCCHDSWVFLEYWKEEGKPYLKQMKDKSVVEMINNSKFDYIFIMDLNYDNKIKKDGIRWEDKSAQIKIHELCLKLYPLLGYKYNKNLFVLPWFNGDIMAQTDFIFKTITSK